MPPAQAFFNDGAPSNNEASYNAASAIMRLRNTPAGQQRLCSSDGLNTGGSFNTAAGYQAPGQAVDAGDGYAI